MSSFQTRLVWFYVFTFLVFSVTSAADLPETIKTGPSTKKTDEEKLSVIAYLVPPVDKNLPSRYSGRHNRRGLLLSLRSHARKTQKSLISILDQQGIRNLQSLWAINAVAFTANRQLISQLARRPDVLDIRTDQVIRLAEPLPATAIAVDWNLDMIQAPLVWAEGFTGQNVIVASMDTGVDGEHIALAQRWRGGGNSWFDPYQQHPDLPYDAHGHGTAVMGLLAGGENNGATIGVAPGSWWIAVKIFNDNAEATFSGIHLGFQWLLDPDGDPNSPDAPDVVNNSWGLQDQADQCVTEFQPDINLLKMAGIAVVFAAGNEGPQSATSLSPANNVGSFSVWSIMQSKVITTSSSRGPNVCNDMIFPDLVAPGFDVRTADLTLGGILPNAETYFSGTSAAAPHVAGIFALLMGAFPDVAVDTLGTIMQQQAEDLGDPAADNIYGWGLANVWTTYTQLEYRTSRGDLDCNGLVDISDLVIFSGYWLHDCTQETLCHADLNHDGYVNMGDYAILRSNYGY